MRWGTLFFHPGAQALERSQRRVERVGGVRAGGEEQVRIGKQAADRRFDLRDVVRNVADLAER